MLSQDDFINMLSDMQAHIARAIKTTNDLVMDLDDTDLRLKLVALGQGKQLHLEALTALNTILRDHRAGVRAPQTSDSAVMVAVEPVSAAEAKPTERKSAVRTRGSTRSS